MSGQGEEMERLINDYHNCANNGGSNAANTISDRLHNMIESNMSDSQTSQNETGNEDGK